MDGKRGDRHVIARAGTPLGRRPIPHSGNADWQTPSLPKPKEARLLLSILSCLTQQNSQALGMGLSYVLYHFEVFATLQEHLF